MIDLEPRFDELRREADAYYLPVVVSNRGGRTVADVSVALTLAAGPGAPESAHFTLPFLAGGGADRVVVIYRRDPSQGSLTPAITYVQP